MDSGGVTLQFCGFGGQGIVLSAVVFGSAAVTQAGLEAVQTQSYGSEARGGECQAELIISEQPIDSPLADQVDILVARSQPAFQRYLDRVRPGGTVVLDPQLVDHPERGNFEVLEVPAAEIASQMGNEIVANMVTLGFVQQASGLISDADLDEAIRSNVPERYVEMNLLAAERGRALAREKGLQLRFDYETS
jgi:2-oxoglutarate ferredoxin oxidoreductase subunit gamma